MDDAVQAYLDAIPAATRPLFDRIHALVLEVHPDVATVISYDMPTFVVDDRRFYLAAWKRWVSFYGWDGDRDGGFLARHPELSSGRGTIKLTPAAAEAV